MAWLHLIRWKNLAIVWSTQWLVWYCLINGHAGLLAGPKLLTTENFVLLSLSTVLIAAAGYIINDYFDIKIDIINRPAKVVLVKRIPPKVAIIAHTILNVVGLLLAGLVAMRGRHLTWLLLPASCTLLLWFYSTHFKRQFLVGNVVVALLTALCIALIVVYEPAMHDLARLPPAILADGGTRQINPVWMAGAYCFFAFMLTFMREVVKDMEDSEGDAAEGCVTMPIKWGLAASTRFVQWLGACTIAALLGLSYVVAGAGNWLIGIYSAVALLLPLAAWMYYLPRKATVEHYHSASKYLKLIMIAGLGSLLVYRLQLLINI